MTSERDVVITGLGLVSPIGIGREAFAQSLAHRQSGVARVTQFDTSALSVHIGAELKDFEPKLYVKPRKSLKVMSREIQMGVASSTLAMEDAKLDRDQIESERFGVVYGSPMLYADNPELADQYRACMVDGKFDFGRFGEQFSKQMVPLWMLKYLPNMTASHIGIAQDARGPNNSVVLGDVSSLAAIAEAASVIERGLADVMLSGGSGSRLSLTPYMYRGDSNLSHQNEIPAAASRPFDANRDGMVVGEGATTIVLESRAHANQRNANILGTIVSCASTYCGCDHAQGMRDAIGRSITACLSKAAIDSTDIDHVNAHGTSEVNHDVFEAKAIREALGDVPVTAPKSYFGNVGAGSSAMELAASLVGDDTPATLNYSDPDPNCAVNVVSQSARSTGEFVLKLSQAGTGQASAVLLRRGR